MIGIYSITNLLDGKRYIGQSVEIEVRIKKHLYFLRNNRHYNEHLQNAWNRDGEENFSIDILEECSRDELDIKERYYIKEYKSNDREFGYNRESGGSFSKEISEETKKKISDKLMGHPVSQETIEKWSNANKGRKAPEHVREMLLRYSVGRTVSRESIEKQLATKRANGTLSLSEETKRKISEALKGRKWTEEQYESTRKYYETHSGWRKGKTTSEETRRKLSEAAKGRVPWNKGRKMTPEEVKKYSEARTGKPMYNAWKPVINLDSVAIYESMQIAQQVTGARHISDVVRGKRNKSGGYRWAFLSDYLKQQ